MFLEFFSCRKPQKHDSRPALSLSRDGVWPIPSGNRVFGVYSCRKPQKHDSRPALSHIPPIPSENRVFSCRVFSCRKPQKHDSRPALSQDGASGPPRSVARWGIGSRQFRAKIVFFGVFSCRKPQKNTIPAPLFRGMGHRVPRESCFLEFLAAENLKNTIPAPLCRGMGHRVPPIPRESCFWSFLAAENLKNTIPAPLCRGMGHRVPPIPSGNRVLGAENLKNRIPAWGIGSGQFRAGIVFLEFLAAENLKNTIPAPLCRGMGHRVPPIPSRNRVFGVFSSNSEWESCFWSF